MRIVAEIESADGVMATISVAARVVTLTVPLDGGAVMALRGGPAAARRIAEAYLLAARIAEATGT